MAFQTGGQEEGQGWQLLHARGQLRESELDDVQASVGFEVGQVAQVSMEEEQSKHTHETDEETGGRGGEGRHVRVEKAGGCGEGGRYSGKNEKWDDEEVGREGGGGRWA